MYGDMVPPQDPFFASKQKQHGRVPAHGLEYIYLQIKQYLLLSGWVSHFGTFLAKCKIQQNSLCLEDRVWYQGSVPRDHSERRRERWHPFRGILFAKPIAKPN